MKRNTSKRFTQIALCVALCLFLSTSLMAFISGWSQIVDPNGTTRAYDQNNKLVWKAWADASGKVHITYYKGIVNNEDDDPFGGIEISSDNLTFQMGIEAAAVEIYDIATGQTVWESGGAVSPGALFDIPLTSFTINLHMMVTLDALGNQTNAILFKKGSTCEGSLVFQ